MVEVVKVFGLTCFLFCFLITLGSKRFWGSDLNFFITLVSPLVIPFVEPKQFNINYVIGLSCPANMEVDVDPVGKTSCVVAYFFAD